MENHIKIRKAVLRDADAIWQLIRELAIYERAENEHTLSREQLAKDLEEEKFTAFVAESADKIVAMAICYAIYSTWKGSSIYLEDIVVNESYRRKGIGSKLFEAVKQFAKAENAGRLGWQVLNWNIPAIQFYKKHNAVLDDEWINCKMTREHLQTLTLANESL